MQNYEFAQRLSHSKLGTSQDCGHKFYASYLSPHKNDTTVRSSWFDLGTLVHNTIEEFYKQTLKTSEAKEFLVLELDRQVKQWAGASFLATLNEYKATYVSLVHQAKAEQEAKTKKPCLNVTATNVWKSTYEKQLDEAYDETVATLFGMEITVPVNRFKPDGAQKQVEILWREDPAKTYELAKQCLMNFLELHERNKNCNVLTEVDLEQYALDHGRDPVVFEGFIFNGNVDRVEYRPDGTCHIFDYKTGKYPHTLGQTLNSDQLSRYAWTWEQLTGHRVSSIGYWDLRAGTTIDTEFNDDVSQRFLNRYKVHLWHYKETQKQRDQTLKGETPFCGPIPSFTALGAPCKNCDLLHEKNPELRCPYFVPDPEQLKPLGVNVKPTRGDLQDDDKWTKR
jgi:hypothetical protein